MVRSSFVVVWTISIAIGLLHGVPGRAEEPNAAPTPRVATINNAVPRLDTEGRIVDAHDGCLHKFGDRFFLYGTAYGKTDGFVKTNHYQCYSSSDLVAWKLEGDLFRNQNPPPGVYYRPYVIYNAKTGKYVLWYNWYPTLWDGQYGVATSDRPEGPFAIQNNNVAVARAKPGDLGLFVDDDAAAYLVYTSIADDHGISVERLSDDYLSSTKENSGILDTGCEAAVMIKRQNTYYVLFDVCCCFCPQGSGARVFTASKPLGPYSTKNTNINRDANGNPIIAAQQTHIAQIPTANGLTHIWMGDRWGSRPDGIKGHDFQYWGPLHFDAAGDMMPLERVDQWTIPLQ